MKLKKYFCCPIAPKTKFFFLIICPECSGSEWHKSSRYKIIKNHSNTACLLMDIYTVRQKGKETVMKPTIFGNDFQVFAAQILSWLAGSKYIRFGCKVHLCILNDFKIYYFSFGCQFILISWISWALTTLQSKFTWLT